MLSNTREKTLTTILGVSVVAAGGYSMLESQVLQPLDAANAQISAAQLRNTSLETEFAAVEHAQRNLGDVSGRSLPEDPSVASVMYQEWLLQRSNEAGFESPLIIPGSPIPVDDVGYRIPFTVQTTAGLRQIGKFLDSFHRSDLLHRIGHASISSESRSSSLRRLNITIEALALEGTPTPKSIPRPGPRQIRQMPLSELFARFDPFRRAVKKKAAEAILAVKETRTEPVDAKSTAHSSKPDVTRFVATVTENGVYEAWFFDENTGRGFSRTVGENLTIGNVSFMIRSVTPHSVEYTDDSSVRRVNLGEVL